MGLGFSAQCLSDLRKIQQASKCLALFLRCMRKCVAKPGKCSNATEKHFKSEQPHE